MKKLALATSVVAILGFAAVGGTFVPSVAQAQMASYTVEFALGSASLDSRARNVVSQAADSFRSGEGASISLVGRTDTTGNAEFNQRLSERRAEAVRDALVAQGVSASAISVDAVGETALVVPTGDNVAEQANRVVTIDVQEPAAAPAPAPAPMAAVTEPVRDTFRALKWTIGGYYGYDMNVNRHLVGINGALDHFLTPNISIGVEQAGFYVLSDHGFGGRSVASLDFHMANMMGDMIASPYIGANAGYIYGAGIHEAFIYGPEVGFDVGPLAARVAWDISEKGIDAGTISATLGTVIRF